MNETTRAILRRELQEAERNIARLEPIRLCYVAVVNRHEADIAKNAGIAADIRAVLLLDTEAQLREVDGMDALVPGTVMRFHTA